MQPIRKYPRTPHLEGSRLQPGDQDLPRRAFVELEGRHVVYEEKLDGANAAFFFDGAGRPHAQSRGHLLDLGSRGGRERHFNLFKDWLIAHQDSLLERLEDRYTVYGEWLHAAHTVYYDVLPHVFMEFDVLDRTTGEWLDTPRRRTLLQDLPISSVPVLYRGPAISLDHLVAQVGPSRCKSPNWRAALREAIRRAGLDPVRTAAKIEDSDLAEGIYGKVEEDGCVVDRFKFVRHGFLQKVFETDEHWLSRPILPNGLAPGADIFAQHRRDRASGGTGP